MLKYCLGKGATDSKDDIVGETDEEPIFANCQLGRIQEGLTFVIAGIIPSNGCKFNIDFMLNNASRDVALRVTGLIGKNQLHRSSKVKNTWSAEETETTMPFNLQSCGAVQIEVLFTVPEFMVAVNGYHAAKYAHRVPFHSVEILAIYGDLLNLSVDKKIVTEYPQRPHESLHIKPLGFGPCCPDKAEEDVEDGYYADDEGAVGGYDTSHACCSMERCLPLPYYATFERGFLHRNGTSVAVTGRIRAQPKIFTISIQTGAHVWPSPVVGLQLQLKFYQDRNGETGEPTIVRNSFLNGKWTGEISSKLLTGLRPLADFTLSVVKSKKTFDIFVNEKIITDFPFKVNPKYMDTVLVSGDIKLFSVDAEF